MAVNSSGKIDTGNDYLCVFLSSSLYAPGIWDVKNETRQIDILNTKNERLRTEKLIASRLLEYAFSFVGDPDGVYGLSKDGNGRWYSPSRYVSITHSGGAVGVAISSLPVGIDIESIDSTRAERICAKFMNDDEIKSHFALPTERRALNSLLHWTGKEAVFKAFGEGSFLPRSIDLKSYPVSNITLEFSSISYLLSICSEIGSLIKVTTIEPQKLFK